MDINASMFLTKGGDNQSELLWGAEAEVVTYGN